MPAPKGSKNAIGNKGGRRKSAYQERQDCNLVYEMFFDPINQKNILDKIATGTYSLKDVFVKKAFDGNDKILCEIFRKIFPDNLNLNMQDTKVLFTLEEETKKILEGIKNKNNVSK